MKIRLICVLILLLNFAKILNAHAGASARNQSELDRALLLLTSTNAGSELLKEAKSAHVPIFPGTVSRTDITATRRTNGDHEKLGYKTQVWVAQDKEAVFQALDISHELVHALHPKENPFDPNLNADLYIKKGIEGLGGEANAIAKECEVGKELVENASGKKTLKNETAQTIRARCKFVWETASDENRWHHSFYQLGQYYHAFLTQVAGLKIEPKERSQLNHEIVAKSPMFHSAVAHKPYPLALLEEYVEITQKVCGSARRSKLGRAVASVGLFKRCQAVGVELENHE